MKTQWMKPGFELIFAISLIAIMAIPPLVCAQGTKNLDIRIINGDTTINGKPIKELSADERKQALKDIDNLSVPENSGSRRIILRKRGLADTGSARTMLKRRYDNKDDMSDMHEFFNDSVKHVFKFKLIRPNGADSVFTYNNNMNSDHGDRFEDREFNFRMREPWRENFHHRNVQRFEYTNTGSDGISTHISLRVSDASPEKLKNTTGAEKAGLEIKDLNLVPEFSSGKMLLMFSLGSKSVAEVRLTDNEGKMIWSEKALNGSFNKRFPLGLNGSYFLQIKQAGKIALKRIIKEE